MKFKVLEPPSIPEDGALAGLLEFMNELLKTRLIAKQPVEEMRTDWQGQARESGRERERRRASVVDIIVDGMVDAIVDGIRRLVDRMDSLIEKENACRPFVESVCSNLLSLNCYQLSRDIF